MRTEDASRPWTDLSERLSHRNPRELNQWFRRSPCPFFSSTRRFGKLRHNAHTSHDPLFTSATHSWRRFAKCFGVSSHNFGTNAADLSRRVRNQPLAVSCGNTSATSPGWARGPRPALVPAHSCKLSRTMAALKSAVTVPHRPW